MGFLVIIFMFGSLVNNSCSMVILGIRIFLRRGGTLGRLIIQIGLVSVQILSHGEWVVTY